MTTKNDGGPAFPCDTIVERDEKGRFKGHEISSAGLSIRDHFAGLAMQGLLARGLHYSTEGMNSPRRGLDDEDIAGHAYTMADAMLAAREAV